MCVQHWDSSFELVLINVDSPCAVSMCWCTLSMRILVYCTPPFVFMFLSHSTSQSHSLSFSLSFSLTIQPDRSVNVFVRCINVLHGMNTNMFTHNVCVSVVREKMQTKYHKYTRTYLSQMKKSTQSCDCRNVQKVVRLRCTHTARVRVSIEFHACFHTMETFWDNHSKLGTKIHSHWNIERIHFINMYILRWCWKS